MRKMRLKDMVLDGNLPGLLVDPAWRDIKHPQEKPKNVSDPTSLRRMAPDVDKAVADTAGALLNTIITPTFGGAT